MKKIMAVLVLVIAESAVVQSADVTCTLTGLTAGQQGLVGEFVAEKNASESPGAPFADFNAFCGYTMRSAVMAFIAQRSAAKLQAIGLSALQHGAETASTPQCTAAGLAAGCKKSEVACFVLTGNTTCS